MGTAAAAIIIRKQRDIVRVFQGAGVTTPDRARDPDALGIDQSLVFKGLVRRAVLREASPGRYYLDEPSWNAMGSRRRRMAVVVLVALIAAGAAVVLTTGLFVHKL